MRFPNDLTFELANISFLIRAWKQPCKLRRKTERKKPTKTPKAPMNQKKKTTNSPQPPPPPKSRTKHGKRT